MCSGWNVVTYATRIDERLRNESKTQFEQHRKNFMQIRIFLPTDQWTLDKDMQIRTLFYTYGVIS